MLNKPKAIKCIRYKQTETKSDIEQMNPARYSKMIVPFTALQLGLGPFTISIAVKVVEAQFVHKAQGHLGMLQHVVE